MFGHERREKLMKDSQPVNISKARELLRKYEKEPNHKMRVRYFADAFDLLDQCISDEPDSDVGHIAKNIRRTYLKQLLESLPSLSTLDIDERFYYFWQVFFKQPDDIKSLCQEDATLKKNYKSFRNILKQELKDLINLIR